MTTFVQREERMPARGWRIAVMAIGMACVSLCSASDLAAQPPAGPTLTLQVNDAALRPGETLVTGVTVNNPGGGPLADFYFVIVLPDGSTAVSAGPGIGARFGRLGDLRSLAPVASSISLGSPFVYPANPFFSYTFTGNEPVGTYRIYFAAVRTGAFADGAIGAGEVLAVAMQDVTFGVSPVSVDTGRRVTAIILPTGGEVQTATVNGTLLTLTLPAGAVNVATSISIAPLVAFEGSPSGPLVAGISAEPSGLVFDPPATLTITMPTGFRTPAFGLHGFVAEATGGHVERLPASLAGNVATIRVPHFSIAGITLNADWLSECATIRSPAMTTACQQLRPLFDAEFARIGPDGLIGAAFKAAVLPIFQTWAQNGILPRLIAAQTPGVPDPYTVASDALQEWVAWAWLYGDVFTSLVDGANQTLGFPLGALIDQVQAQARLTFTAGMNGINIKCLADKSNVSTHVGHVTLLHANWFLQFSGGSVVFPFTEVNVEYCADLRIDAAPPPAVTVGQVTLVPVDVRVRFIDGVELPGRQAAVTITANPGLVTPAGGIVSLPLATSVTLTPSATNGTLTVSAALVEPIFQQLPARSRVFPFGEANSQRVTVVSRAIAFTGSARAGSASAPISKTGTDQLVANLDVASPGPASADATTRATAQIIANATQLQMTGNVTVSGNGDPGHGATADANGALTSVLTLDLAGPVTCQFDLATQHTESRGPATTFGIRVERDGALFFESGVTGVTTQPCGAGRYVITATAEGAIATSSSFTTEVSRTFTLRIGVTP